MLGKNLMSDQPLLQFGSLRLVNPYAPSSPLYADYQAFIDNFNEKLRDRYSNVISSKGLYAAWRNAMRHGSRSLPRDQLIAMAKSQVAVLPRMSEHGCADMIRPQDDFDAVLGADIRQTIEQLPPRHHKNINEFFYDSLMAEIDDAPAINVDDEAFKGALLALGQNYPGEYGERLVRVVKNPKAASDEDACWAINIMMHMATLMPPDHAEAFLRRSFVG